MENHISVKFCGFTDIDSLKEAVALGADFLGINLYQPSPRSINLGRIDAFLNVIPDGKRVAVMVHPAIEELKELDQFGFDFFQLHFDAGLDGMEKQVREWALSVSPQRLWLAPRRVPDQDYPVWVTQYCRSILLDAFSTDLYGGSGIVANWTLFRELKAAFSQHNWILAGGLKPDNVADAITQSGTSMVDAASGIEFSPGIKDPKKMRTFLTRVNACRDGS